VQLDLLGVGTLAATGTPARLSLDVTRKPLMRLVWYGLYVMLAGGVIATTQRLRQSFVIERVGGSQA
jgi:cytochrome c biogenesis factor